MARHLHEAGLDWDAQLLQHFATDMRKSVYHNAANGHVTLQGNTRAYLHFKDRSMPALEYALHQGWGEEVDLDDIHKPMPTLKALAKAARTKVAATTVAAGEAPAEVVLEPAHEARPKKRQRGCAAQSGSAAGKGESGAAAGGRAGRGCGQQYYQNKVIELMGNAVNLPDLSVNLVSEVLAAGGEHSNFEHPPNFNDLEFLTPSKPITFKPNLNRLDDEVESWTIFYERFKEHEAADSESEGLPGVDSGTD